MIPARPGARAWLALALLLAAGSLLAWALPAGRLEWQPALAAREPWRAFSAAAVHYSALHLGANLAGTALVAALGVQADLPPRSAAAWLVAWPLTQLGLLLRPELAHFGGLSGVLHAGVAVAALHLVVAGRGRRRLVGAALLAGLLVKVLGEDPGGAVLQYRTGWDIPIAPIAHATGLVAGVLCGLLASLLPNRPHD